VYNGALYAYINVYMLYVPALEAHVATGYGPGWSLSSFNGIQPRPPCILQGHYT